MSTKKSIYTVLSSVDMAKHIEIVQKQKYISWSRQWGELLKHYPDAVYEVHENEVGDPFTVSTMGIMVKVSVTIDGLTRTLNYPVLNTANKALKIEAYSYMVKEYSNGRATNKMIEKWVEPATTFNINTAIMRAITKCISLFGLSLYIYKDELSPDVQKVDSSQLQAIMDKIKEKHISAVDVRKAWNLNGFAELHEENFIAMMEWLELN